jgi:hypothetical protein
VAVGGAGVGDRVAVGVKVSAGVRVAVAVGIWAGAAVHETIKIKKRNIRSNFFIFFYLFQKEIIPRNSCLFFALPQ